MKQVILEYFFLMGEPQRKIVSDWFNKVNPKLDSEKGKYRNFLERVKRALEVINYDYYIATLEPSFDEVGNIFYKEGEVVAREIRLDDWKERATHFYSDGNWHSELAMLEEGDFFKAYRIAVGYWSLEYVCDDSSAAGNYCNAPDSAHDFEVSGSRIVGGFKDGIGNTYEIYQTTVGFAVVGGFYRCDGNSYPVAGVYYRNNPARIGKGGSGVLVLKHSTVH